MSARFLLSLSWQNIRRNRQAYLPYALSCAGAAAMYFIMLALSNTPTLMDVYGGRTIQRTLAFGTQVMLIFSVVFVFYTHSFLMKRRGREMALFHMLGMDKRHLMLVTGSETLLIALASTLLGVGLGALLTRLMYLVLIRMLQVSGLPPLVLPGFSVWATAGVFLAIHALTLLRMLFLLRSSDTAALLKSGSMGERQPRGNPWLTLLGAASLGAGYSLSLSFNDPLAYTALPVFFQAVVLVVISTYALFAAGSVTVLRRLRKNQRFYYKPQHFSVIAGMIHRMRRNAVGLATICILSTMVLVMVTAATTLFLGQSRIARGQIATDASFQFGPVGDSALMPAFQGIVAEEAACHDMPVHDAVSYLSLEIPAYISADRSIVYAWDEPQPEDATGVRLYLISLEDYSRATGRSASLNPDELLAHAVFAQALPEHISLFGHPFDVKANLENIAPIDNSRRLISPKYFLILPEAAIAALHQELAAQHDLATLPDGKPAYRANIGFNTGDLHTDQAFAVIDTVQKRAAGILADQGSTAVTTFGNHFALILADFYAVYGGLLFVAVMLGFMFTAAMALIIYYKQISEGLEDSDRFAILQQVGMSHQEVRQSIRTQVLLVFFLPLATAGLHLAAAQNILRHVLMMMGLEDVAFIAVVSLAVYALFALLYIAVYTQTARSYYKLVRRD
ncbi:MAG: ABC transporter permease [Christensenellales bacterium]|jgi:putative ABC transport system permease protein